MKTNIKNLSIQKYTISKLEMQKVAGGVQTSCVPTCNIGEQEDKVELPTILYK